MALCLSEPRAYNSATMPNDRIKGSALVGSLLRSRSRHLAFTGHVFGHAHQPTADVIRFRLDR